MSNIKYDIGKLPSQLEDFSIDPGALKGKTSRESSDRFFRETGSAIPYSIELATIFQEQVRLAFKSPDPLFFDPTYVSESPAVNGEIKRFIVALVSYLDIRSRPRQTLQELWEGIMDHDFCNKLKKIRLKSIVKHGIVNGMFSEWDTKLDDLPVYHISDVGEIFNYRNWIFWEEDDPHDEEYSWIECPPLTPEFCEEYSDALWSILPDSVEAIDPKEVLLQVTGSGSALPGGKSSKVYIDKTQLGQNSFSNGPLTAKLVFVQNSPGDSRRASVLPVNQSNTIKLIEKQLALIADKMEDSIYVKDKQEFQKRFDKFESTYNRFLMRDMRKDGLTKNRELVVLTMHVIAKKYPNLHINMYKDFYKVWRYYYEENPSKMYYPPRGTGLGMWSAGTTIMQCTLKRMATTRCLRDDELGFDGHVGGLFYHDDAVIGFHSQADLDTYDSIEDDLFLDARLIKSAKKSFEGDNFVICEVYSNRLNLKHSYQLTLLNSPFYASNVTEAKLNLQQLVKFTSDFDPLEWIAKYEAYWGYEFSPLEFQLPTSFGGWIPAEYRGVDTSWFFYDEEDTRLFRSLFKAVTTVTLERPLKKVLRNDKSLYRSPLNQMFGNQLELDGFEANLYYNQTCGYLHTQMCNFMQLGSKVKGYKLLNKRRREVFNEYMLHPSNSWKVSDFYNEYIRHFPFKDVVPPRSLAATNYVSEYKCEEKIYYKIFTSGNPTLSFIKFHNGQLKTLNSIVPSCLPPNATNTFSSQLTSQERKTSLRTVGLLGGAYSQHSQVMINYSDTDYDFSRMGWYNPYNVAAAWTAYTLEPKLPTYCPKGSIYEKIEVFRNSIFNQWIQRTQFKDAFLYCVQRLGWNYMAKESYMSDEFFSELIHSIQPERSPSPEGDEPWNIPLPKEDLEEIFFLGEDIYGTLKHFLSFGISRIEDDIPDRGYDSESVSSEDVVDFDEFNPLQFDSENSSEDSFIKNQRMEHAEYLASLKKDFLETDDTTSEESDDSEDEDLLEPHSRPPSRESGTSET